VVCLQVLGDLPVDALPGVGWALKGRLAELGITQCRQVGVLHASLCGWYQQLRSRNHLCQLSRWRVLKGRLAELGVTQCRQVGVRYSVCFHVLLQVWSSSEELLIKSAIDMHMSC
jgi:hypothetical protein